MQSNKDRIRYSNRADDITKERIVASLMREIYKENGFTPFGSKKDMDIKGIDVILYRDNKQYFVDEKAAITALNGKLNTFCFELCKHGYNDLIGWFVDRGKLITHYNIIYITAESGDVAHPEKIESFLLDSNKLRSYVLPMLVSNDIRYNTLYQTMKKEPLIYGKRYLYLDNKIKICFSEYLRPEQPINVIIPKYILKDMAEYIFYKEYARS